ncbi:MAG: hypothetical protein VB080_10350 [Propionicimonas sp.]|uniref:hypothetical protein n=1 Tax=Propionicimonas sp. TaxID=1955623 RepID=UPI002B20623C|nr:hypothetical protein [Propionicimonas sp.]MEA4944818.1 hypothetical protein [Propionicimonas sp.]
MPEIDGTPRYRSTLSIDEPTWGPGRVKLRYQWLRGNTAISGATSTSYKVAAADIDHSLRIRVTGTRKGFATATVDAAPVGPVAPGKLSASDPEITGTARVGNTLTADVDPWGPGEVTLAWQWYRGDEKIAKATKRSYKLAAADHGQLIKVRVVGTAKHFAKTTRYSEQTGKVAPGKLGPTPDPAYNGIAQVGQKVTALPREWGPGEVKLSYQWFREGKEKDEKIESATKASHVFTPADLGKRLRVRVTGSKTGYQKVARYSGWTVEVSAGTLTPAKPVITGLAVKGTTLTAQPGTWAPDGVTFTYRWYSDGVLNTRALGDSYLLGQTDVGHTITVRVKGELTGYQTVILESAPTDTVLSRERGR